MILNSFIIFFVYILFLCWGSFLNVLAYRIIFKEKLNLFKRSSCPSCNSNLSAFDLVPVVSYIFLKGKCRYCAKKISSFYPFIEIFTATVLTIIFIKFFNSPNLFFFYFLFVSAMIVNIRTDLESMLLSRYFTLFLAPLGFLFAFLKISTISIQNSIIGFLIGFLILFLFKKIYFLITKKEGLGDGDIDLVACIGAFLGPMGVWASLFWGSLIGSLISIFLILTKKITPKSKVPFGPLLALGSILWILFQKNMLKMFF